MARNQSDPWKVLSVVFGLMLLVTGGGGVTYLFLKSGDSLSNLPEFPVDSYFAGGNFLSGSDFKLSGRVDNIILRSADQATVLVSLDPGGAGRKIPVLVKAGSKGRPIQREQNLLMKVSLGVRKEVRCVDYRLK